MRSNNTNNIISNNFEYSIVEETFSRANYLMKTFWAIAIRVVFCLFVWHSVLFLFTLFEYVSNASIVAKVAHRGCFIFKLPLLAGLLFLTYLINDQIMAEFQYMIYVMGATFGLLIALMIQKEISQ